MATRAVRRLQPAEIRHHCRSTHTAKEPIFFKEKRASTGTRRRRRRRNSGRATTQNQDFGFRHDFGLSRRFSDHAHGLDLARDSSNGQRFKPRTPVTRKNKAFLSAIQSTAH